MDIWQLKHIQANLPYLIQTTCCTEPFLAVLTSKNAIGQFDKEELGYEIIAEALRITGQTGALDVLLTGYVSSGNVLPSEFACVFQSWSDLNQKGKEAVLSKRISFFGNTISLNEIGKIISRDKLLETCHQAINGDVLKHFLQSVEPVFEISEPRCSDPPIQYIYRTISSRSNVDLEVLHSVNSDIKVIKNIEWDELLAIVKDTHFSYSGTYIRENCNPLAEPFVQRINHIILEEESHFDTICSFARHQLRSVHLLDYQKTHLKWIKSNGSVELIQTFLSKQQTENSEKQFVTNLNTDTTRAPILIADSPGMGKTTLLLNMAKQARQMHKDALIVFMTLSTLIQSFSEVKTKIDIQLVMKAFAGICCTTDLFQSLTQHILQLVFPRMEVQFYLDGFDEVLVSEIPVMTEVLKVIQQDWPKSRLLVTTRQHLMEDLEKDLVTLGHNTLPFSRNNQKEFLLSYWCTETGLEKNDKLREFTNDCLDYLEDNLTENDRTIAGVPLQCSILAEVYAQEAKIYTTTNPKKFDAKYFISIRSIYDMFEKLVEMRFTRLDCEQKQVEETTSYLMSYWKYWVNSASLIDKVKDAHIYAALQILFPSHFQKFEKQLLSSRADYIPLIKFVGLLEEFSKDGSTTPKFFHRTFSEFLLADFVIDVMLTDKKKYWSASQKLTITKFFIQEVLRTSEKIEHMNSYVKAKTTKDSTTYEFSNAVVCYFFNSALRNTDAIDLQYFNSVCKQTVKKANEWFPILMASIYHNFLHIFRLLIIPFNDKISLEDVENKEDMQTNLRLMASRFADAVLYDEVSNTPILLNIYKCSDVETLSLYHAIYRGNSYVYSKLSKTIDLKEVASLMHCCVANSIKDPKHIIQEKIKIINLLVAENPESINEIDKDTENTPLLSENIALDLLKVLIANGARVTDRCKRFKNTFIHNAISWLSVSELEELSQYLHSTGKFMIFGLTNEENRTPLEEIIIQKHSCLLPSTIELILKHQKDSSASLDVSHTMHLIQTIVENSIPLTILETVINSCEHWNKCNSFGETALHFAIRHANVEAVKLLVDRGCAINFLTQEKVSPLYLAKHEQYSDLKKQETIVKFLQEHGAN